MIKKMYRKYFSSEFFRNVFTLTSGSFLAQLIPILLTPVLTRLFSSEVFGIYFIYASIIGILAIVSTLRFEMAILLPEDEKGAANLLAISIFTSFIISVLSLIILLIFHNSIIKLLDIEKIGVWIFFVPLSVFLIGSFQSLSYWSNRNKKYTWISRGKINRSMVSTLGQVITGFSPVKAIGLIPGLIIGQLTSTIFLFSRNIRQYKYIIQYLSIKELKSVIKKYKDIPIYNTIINAINTLSHQLPFYLLAPFFGASVVGYFGLSNKVIRAPVTLIGESIGHVAYRKASELLNEGKSVFELVKKNYINAFKLSFIPYLILFLFAPQIFLIFGKEWVIAGEYTRVLTPYFFVAFLNSTNPFLITLLNKQKLILVYDSLLLIARFLSIYVGYKVFNDAKIVITLFSAVSLFFNIIFVIIVLVLAKKSALIKRY